MVLRGTKAHSVSLTVMSQDKAEPSSVREGEHGVVFEIALLACVVLRFELGAFWKAHSLLRLQDAGDGLSGVAAKS
jgi:hypothetical protein